MIEGCLCIACSKDRAKERLTTGTHLSELFTNSFRYACEICGNKRCPHHSDHRLACTNSNEPGQPGSVFTKD